MKKLALHWKILLGMVLGVIFGFAMSNFEGGKEIVQDWIKPFGTIFINSLKLIAVPLILGSLIKGVSDLKDISKLSKMGGKTILIYIFTTVIAVSIGLLLVNVIKPGNSISEETRTELVGNYTESTQKYKDEAASQKESGPLQALIDLVPENIIGASSENKNMLQVIFFAIFFGIGLILIPESKSKPVKDFFDGFNEVILKMIDLIMLAAPFGVFALLAALVVESPSADLFKALGWYALTVLFGLSIMVMFYITMVFLFTGKRPKTFIDGIFPAQLLAFSTSSSAATLPVTMERVHEHLGVDEEVSSFVLPIGATINMDGTALYECVAAIFIAQAYGVDLTFVQQIIIVFTALLASIGAAAIPMAGLVMMSIILKALGLPLEAVGYILAVDRILDMLADQSTEVLDQYVPRLEQVVQRASNIGWGYHDYISEQWEQFMDGLDESWRTET